MRLNLMPSFAIDQMYRYSFTRPVLLLLITLVDVVVIWLVWMEYRNLHQIRRGIASS